MKRIRVVTILLILAGGAHATDGGQGQSIMFEDRQNDRRYLTTAPDNDEQSRGDHCEQLLREADGLKGKPQRRSAMMERYRTECELQ